MRILIGIHQFFPKHYTGTEQFVLNIVKQFQKMGHDVEIITYGITDSLDTFKDNFGNILWKEYFFEGIKVTALRHFTLDGWESFNLFDAGMVDFFRYFLKKKRFDVIFIAHSMRIGVIITAALDLKIPVALVLTDFWLICPRGTLLKADFTLCSTPLEGRECCRGICYSSTQEAKLLTRYHQSIGLLNKINTIISPSRFLQDIFQNAGIKKEFLIIKYGINYSFIKPKLENNYSGSRIITFGFIGTILRHKGVDILIRAFLKTKNNNIKLKIFGGYFNEVDYYKKIVELSKNDQRIEFCGEYNYKQFADVMSKIDVVVAPSIWWENSPLTILSSFACKTPVVASDVGGMSELIEDGINGFTFEIGDSDKLSGIIAKIANNPSIINKLINNINLPPRIEEEAFQYELLFKTLT